MKRWISNNITGILITVSIILIICAISIPGFIAAQKAQEKRLEEARKIREVKLEKELRQKMLQPCEWCSHCLLHHELKTSTNVQGNIVYNEGYVCFDRKCEAGRGDVPCKVFFFKKRPIICERCDAVTERN